MAFLQRTQLDLMLILCGICSMLIILVLMTRSLSPHRKRILALLEASAALLLLADRFAYIYHGDPSRLGFWMVRICNFSVYALSLYQVHGITLYLCDLFENEGGLTRLPRRLVFCEGIFVVGIVLLIISQFNGMYYTFDAQNVYHRSPGNILCFAVPILIILIQLTVVIQYRKNLSRGIRISLIIYDIMPIIASVIQYFCYGISLINLTVAAMTAMLYLFALSDMNKALEHARQREIEYYREEQKKEYEMFSQTAGALAGAIDAKDRYTNGHSRRVAKYSRMIAHEVGKSEKECNQIYFAALLHDVGKIGIPGAILNKNGKLTDEEFAQIKQHPVIGGQILRSIQGSPYLSMAARHHHERYDGRGYPDGLKGDAIPEIARIVAVADSYDAMTSNRSYRSAIPQQTVRQELVNGIGTQFDPEFARVMIRLIDQDAEYRMREIVSAKSPSPAV